VQEEGDEKETLGVPQIGGSVGYISGENKRGWGGLGGGSALTGAGRGCHGKKYMGQKTL